jgi:steroid delta-isomerase-like uncharacterized protein
MPDANAVLRQWFQAMEARNLDQITDLLADDVTVETESMRQPITGKQMLSDMLRQALGAYESIRVEPRKVIGSGREAAALVDLHVRFGADVDTMGEKLPTAGKSLNVRAAVFVEVNEAGKIARVLRVRDTWGIIDQLGLSPERVKALMQKFETQMKGSRSRAA